MYPRRAILPERPRHRFQVPDDHHERYLHYKPHRERIALQEQARDPDFRAISELRRNAAQEGRLPIHAHLPVTRDVIQQTNARLERFGSHYGRTIGVSTLRSTAGRRGRFGLISRILLAVERLVRNPTARALRYHRLHNIVFDLWR